MRFLKSDHSNNAAILVLHCERQSEEITDQEMEGVRMCNGVDHSGCCLKCLQDLDEQSSAVFVSHGECQSEEIIEHEKEAEGVRICNVIVFPDCARHAKPKMAII